MSDPTRVLPREALRGVRRWHPGVLRADHTPPGAMQEPGLRTPAAQAATASTDTLPLRWPTAEELSALRDAAHAEGYAEGLATAQEETRRLGGLLDSLHASIGRLESELAPKVLDLAMDIAREVVRSAIDSTPETVLAVIQEALAVLPQSLHHLTLHLHPDDAELVGRHLQEHPLSHPVRLRSSPAITRGGCQIGAAEGDLDATLETRWARVLATLGRSDAWNRG